ncbi:MAG: phosphoribosylaminoimidazolesuccinocarboxamide synthase [Ignavibacteriales bacterium]|nr:phosphoribosylaminoimidazolesuccinocarboxamide synthase [Ignavibacteriales bacterium]
MNYFTSFTTPQIKKIHAGKVRDSFSLDAGRRMIVVTDRISAFDRVLKSPIPMKGAVLNGIANFWFHKTEHIIENHLLEEIDANITIVKQVTPVKIEMIVRGYLTGSMWRYYSKGKREFSGISVPDGLTKNQKFPEPILTPTTKEDSDREITPDDIIAQGLASKEVYETIARTALALYKFGSEYLYGKGIILVDTKYEFGLLNGKVVLIDEIHTPDSSRFWRVEDYKANPDTAEQIDKEFVRQWLISNEKNGEYPQVLPGGIITETTKRYADIYRMVTGEELPVALNENVKARIYHNLVKAGLIKPGYVALVMGSAGDKKHAESIAEHLKPYKVHVEMRVTSAHKNGENILQMADMYNNSIEPGVLIAIAGRSNGLGGALAANVNVPVINCPPFKDVADIMMNVNSSLMMPSATPAVTVIHPDNAALAAIRALNLHNFREIFSAQIQKQKQALAEADAEFLKESAVNK